MNTFVSYFLSPDRTFWKFRLLHVSIVHCVSCWGFGIPLYRYTVYSMHTPVDGHFGSFQFLAIVNKTAVSIHVYQSLYGHTLHFSWVEMTEMMVEVRTCILLYTKSAKTIF